jgi:hypothetical protein
MNISYKDGKWARDIISLQNKNGSWGYFHTLSQPNKNPITTEQALKRLLILGYSIDDEPIQRAVEYMINCLSGKYEIPDRREKVHNWDVFTDLMLSAWIRKFTLCNDRANNVSAIWSKVISSAFSSGYYNHQDYLNAYNDYLLIKAKGGRILDFVNFYQISLIAGNLSKDIERSMFDYVLSHNSGIYYIYDKPLNVLPIDFATKDASRYIGAIELLSVYKHNHDKLSFVVQWLMSNKNENGMWDMGSKVNDKIYFPLSDTWRKAKYRVADCTYKIEKLINKLSD